MLFTVHRALSRYQHNELTDRISNDTPHRTASNSNYIRYYLDNHTLSFDVSTGWIWRITKFRNTFYVKALTFIWVCHESAWLGGGDSQNSLSPYLPVDAFVWRFRSVYCMTKFRYRVKVIKSITIYPDMFTQMNDMIVFFRRILHTF
jgi:hypothetical protein